MTLKDIAEKAGVSMMTVSNVINGKTDRVSAKTMDKVNHIINECGYTPNLNARSLTNKTSNIIGLIIPADSDSTEENFLENPYTSTMIGIIEKELRQNGYFVMVRSVFKGTDITSLLQNWNVDGMIFLNPTLQEYLPKLIETCSCPIAIFDSHLEIHGLINVCSNDRKGLYLSTKYLINHGHSRIAFIADYENNHLLTERYWGYRQALEECGIPYRPEYVYSFSPDYESGIKAGKKLVSDCLGITGVVTTADICAIGIIEGARLSGYRIPIDLSVIGYDDLKIDQYTSPKLTSISQNIPQKALMATRLLLEKIRTGQTSIPSPVIMDVEIAERQSAISLF